MHNPTRRSKRFKRPLSSAIPLSQVSGTGDARSSSISSNDSPTNDLDDHVRYRRAAQPDMLRSAMLVTVIVVTVVLYVILLELERSSFTSVSNPNRNWNSRMAFLPSGTSRAISTWYPYGIAMNRPILHSKEDLKLLDDRIAERWTEPSLPTSNTWLPPVTPVPEVRDMGTLTRHADDRSHENEDTKRLASFDAAYCSGACRFLLPVRIGEQESKARVHLIQLVMLARRLGRTIVLPNVGKSRMSACSGLPFGAYYDTSVFTRRGDSPDAWLAIDLEVFSKWVDERPKLPSSFVVSMDSLHLDLRGAVGTQTSFEDVPFIQRRVGVDPKILSCLEYKLAPLHFSLQETALSISVDPDSLKSKSDTPSRLVELLSGNLDVDADSEFDPMTGAEYGHMPRYVNSSYPSLADVDVLVLDYDLRYPLFSVSSGVNFDLYYAPVLYDLADRLVDNLGPFLGVHWRMENVPLQNLAWCAASLVNTLHVLLQDNATGEDVRYVWLGTDYPRSVSSFVDSIYFPVDDNRPANGIGGGQDERLLRNSSPLRKSSTFKTVSTEHDDAIGILMDAFQPGGELEAWKLTDLTEQLHRYPYVEGKFTVDEALLDDPGVLGILDKLVIVQAKAFISGSTNCGKTSAFSKQVIEARRESLEVERSNGAIRNVVEYFGKW